MKKALLIGAVVSSMALSSVAFAAVDYENATAWTKGTDFNYDIATGVLTVANGKTNAAATTDTTIVVVNGENPTTIDQTNIMYIDQAASADTYGNMGLLLPETIADGAKATVLFNDGTAAIYTATFDLKEAAVTPDGKNVDIVWGDVDFSGAADLTDALYVLAAKSGGTKIVGDNNVEKFAIDSAIVDDIVWGDVDFSGAADLTDALYVLAAKSGGTKIVGDNNVKEYAIDSPYTITIAAE